MALHKIWKVYTRFLVNNLRFPVGVFIFCRRTRWVDFG